MFQIPINPYLSLRLLMKSNAQELFELVDQSKAHLAKWLPWARKVENVEEYQQLLPRWLADFAANRALHVGIFAQDQLIGIVGFHYFDQLNHQTSIGYWLGESFQGKGYMTMAVKKMLEIAFQQYDMNRVEIRCAVDNHRSRAVPVRLGFREEGILREVERIGEQYVDHVVYGLTKTDWVKSSKLSLNIPN